MEILNKKESSNKDKRLAILTINSDAQDFFKGAREFDFRKKWEDQSLIGEKIYICNSLQNRSVIIGYAKLLEVLKSRDLNELLEHTGNRYGLVRRETIDYFNREHALEYYALHLGETIPFKQPLSKFEMNRILPVFDFTPNVTYIRKNNILYWVLMEWEKQLGPDCQDPIKIGHKILAEARKIKK